MVYKKHYKRKPKPRSRWQNYSGAASQLVKDVNYLKKMVNVEMKLATLSISASPTYSGAISIMNNPAQGDTDLSRDGDSIKNQDVTISMIARAGLSSAIVRVIVFWDKQNKITSVSEFLDSTYVGGLFAPIAPRDYDHRFECKTLFDKVFALPINGQDTRVFEENIKIGLHTQFEAGSTTINTGALKVLYLSDKNANLPTLQFLSRLHFTDN